MGETVILPWLHYVAIVVLSGAVFSKLYLLKLVPTSELVGTLVRVDRIEGAAAVLVFLTGLGRVWHGAGKPAEWYWSNGLFHGVVGLFVLAAALSLVPTMRFLRWKRELAAGTLPGPDALRRTRIFSHVILTLIVLIALLITMVAKGYGRAAA